jgi:hypothetical protein
MIEAIIEKLLLMKLYGMAEGLREQMNNVYRDLSFEERFGLLLAPMPVLKISTLRPGEGSPRT